MPLGEEPPTSELPPAVHSSESVAATPVENLGLTPEEELVVRRRIDELFDEDPERCRTQKLRTRIWTPQDRANPEIRQHLKAAMSRLYSANLTPNWALKLFCRCDITSEEKQRLKEEMERGGFLNQFVEGGVGAQLDRDLPEPNYFVLGLEDPQRECDPLDATVCFCTGYYPKFGAGKFLSTECPPIEPEGFADGHDIVDPAILAAIKAIELVSPYERFILSHLERIETGGTRKHLDHWQKNPGKVIFFDTISVDRSLDRKKGWKGVGERGMYETCKFLMQELADRPDHRDFLFMLYLFHNVIPVRYDGTEAPWNEKAQELAMNGASMRLYKGFREMGTHTDLHNLIRVDYGASTGPLSVGVAKDRREIPRLHPPALEFHIEWLNKCRSLENALKQFQRPWIPDKPEQK